MTPRAALDWAEYGGRIARHKTGVPVYLPGGSAHSAVAILSRSLFPVRQLGQLDGGLEDQRHREQRQTDPGSQEDRGALIQIAGHQRDPEPDGDARHKRQRPNEQHLLHPADIGSVVTFLASEQAKFVTGTTWVVDGGWLSY